jgi:ABC-type uncharacterized transport system permease subunit
MDRLSVLCFAGTYTLALASDLARFVVRSKARWYLTVGLTALGWAVQTAYLANLAWQSHRLPIATVFESLLVLAWILAAIDLYLVVHSPKPVAVGLFILPVVLALVTVAGLSAPRDDWSRWGGQVNFWGWVHGLFLLFGAVFTCVAFVAGLMYLMQANRLKHKRPLRFGLALPSLEQSERLNRAAISVAFPLLTFGLLIGLVLDLAVRRGPAGMPMAWTDPKVLSAGAMWLVFAALLHARYRPAMRGRRVMLLTVVAFAFMIFAWVGVSLLHLPTGHGGSQTAGRAM